MRRCAGKGASKGTATMLGWGLGLRNLVHRTHGKSSPRAAPVGDTVGESGNDAQNLVGDGEHGG